MNVIGLVAALVVIVTWILTFTSVGRRPFDAAVAIGLALALSGLI